MTVERGPVLGFRFRYFSTGRELYIEPRQHTFGDVPSGLEQRISV